MKPKSNRLLAAILFAPLSVPALFLFVLVMLGGALREVVEIVAFAAPVSYLGFLFLGLPSFFALQRSGRANLWSLLVAGAIGGAITMLVFSTLLFGVSTWQYATLGNIVGQILWGVGLGVCVAISFCLIAGITRRSTGRAQTAVRAG